MKTNREDKPKIFTKPLLLFCEGYSDLVFFRKLLASMDLLDRFEVEFAGREHDSGGRSKFGSHLANLKLTSSSFRSSIKNIILFTDSDTDHNKAFDEVIASMKAVNFVSIPPALETFGTQPGFKLFIVTVPGNSRGSIETLCLQAAYDKFGIGNAVDSYIDQTDAKNWSDQKKDKAKLHVAIAGTCKSKPDASLAQHWQESDADRISIEHKAFEEVRRAISKFIGVIDGGAPK